MKIAERIITEAFNRVGVTVNGIEPWDIRVNDSRFYWRVLSQGSLGLGESFMAGWWDCQSLDQFFERLLRNGLPWVERLSPPSVTLALKSKLRDLAPKHLAFNIGKVHYDLGNSLFESMLDPTMSYSCGYNFEEQLAGSGQLHAAQVAKLDLICRKLELEPGQRVLDIGCGWGGLAHHAATKYGVEVIGLTVSKEQAVLARKRCQHLPVDIRLMDYRDIRERFDHIMSVGMFEHVGPKNYRTYMKMVARCLRPNGLFLLHTIGMNPKFDHSVDAWIVKYIFPGGEVPTRRQIIVSSGKERLAIRDWHEFGTNYDRTLMAWHSRFVAAWPELKDKYEHQVRGQFYRMWVYYLLSCAALFRTGNTKLWQAVLAHSGKHQDYSVVR